MTIRLTEAFSAVSSYLQNKTTAVDTVESTPDSGYSLTMQSRIGGLYDQLLDHLHSYYTAGMNNLYLREEGTLRHRYKATLRHLSQTIQGLQRTQEWPGSATQHHQVKTIGDFAAAFYENMLIKPKEQEVHGGNDLKAEKLYHAGSLALDIAIKRGVLELENNKGLICPGARHRSEQNFMLLLSSYSETSYVSEALIKLYLLKSLSALCEYLEAVL